jgi:hypothetical protein
LPAGFDDVVLACLAKKPEARPQTAAELAERLRALVSADGWTVERAERWWQRHRPPNSWSEDCEACNITLMPALTPEADAAEPVSAGRG